MNIQEMNVLVKKLVLFDTLNEGLIWLLLLLLLSKSAIIISNNKRNN